MWVHLKSWCTTRVSYWLARRSGRSGERILIVMEDSQRPHQAEEALKDMAAPGISLLVLLLVPVIYLAIVSVAG